MPANALTSPDAIPPAAQPSGLLVVTIDRLPAWMMSAYGATWVAMPAIDRLAAGGLLFDRAITPSTSIAATLADLVTAPGPAGLLAAAAERGWRPGIVTDDPAVAAMGADLPGVTGGVRLIEAVARPDVAPDDGQTTIARLVDAAIEVLADRERRLVWCHVGSLGLVWDAPHRHRERYIDPDDPAPPAGAGVPSFPVAADTDPDRVVGARQVFAGQLTLLDGQLARLFEAVRRAEGATGGWGIAVIGGRGLPLGLHGWVGAGGRDVPFGELVHVPAIIVDAAGRMAGQRYGGLVIPADLGCTLADLVRAGDGGTPPRGIDATAPWRGASYAGLFETWSAPVRDRVIVTGPGGAAVVAPAWHCLPAAPETASSGGARGAAGDSVRLFAKPDDFFELADVANRCADVAGPLGDLGARAAAGDAAAAWLGPLPAAAGG